MHEFAAQRLEELAETDALSRRHVRWIIGLTAPLTAALRGPDALSWTAMVNDEIANMTSAMRWSLAEGDASDGLQIAVNLGWYSFLSANIHDDHPMLLSLLDRATDAPVALRCRAMAWAGLLSIGHSDGRTWALDAVDVARTAASVSGGDAPHVRQQHGIEMTVASIELARSLGDDAILREVLCIGALHIAAIGKAGDQVASLAAELRGIAKAVGDDWHAALSIGLEGLAAYIVGDLEHARRSYDACLVELRRLGDFGTAAMFEICSAETTEFVADLESAIDSIGVAFALGSVGEFRSATILCSVLCWLTARNGEVERSLQLGAEALAAVRRPFNPVIRAQALFALGAAEETAGLVELADAHLNEALVIHQQVRMVRETAMDHRQLGYLATARGRRADALVHHRRALQLALDVGLRWTIMLTARGLAEALLEDEQVVRACELTGISESIAAEYGYVPTADERRRLDLLVERSEVSIGADGVREALASGAASGVAGLAPALSD
jgi:tetratricopeptide (TPR) repeat protein